MTGRVQHDPYASWVAVGWLPLCFGTPSLDGQGNRSLNVVDEDLEVHHLGLHTGAFWPCRRLVPILGPDVEVHASSGVTQVCPLRGVWTHLPESRRGADRSRPPGPRLRNRW